MTTVPLRQLVTVVVVFVLICSSFVVLDRQNLLTPVRDGLSEVVSPVSRTFYEFADGPASDSELQRQLDEVTAERDALRAENSRLRGDQTELQQLREQQEVADRRPDLDLIPAQITGRDPTGAQEFLVINKGSADGIAVGMAVVDPNYYVGQVVEVTDRTSKVMLLIDTSQKVGAMLQDTRADGVVYGQWQMGGYLEMRNVDTDTIPKEGEWIVTSDVSASQTVNVPPDLPIGQVMGEPDVDPQTAQLTIDVRPGVGNFDDLDIVWVTFVDPEA